MTNYYDTLGLPDYENSQEAIKQAYKRGTQRLSEAATGNSNVAAQLIRLNEAFLVLSDVDLKQHYDYCLRYNLPSTYLEQAIEARRKRAKAFIESKLSTPPPFRKKRSMSTPVKVLIVVGAVWAALLQCAILIAIFCGIADGIAAQDSPQGEQSSASAVELGSYVPDGDWNRYELDNAFSISIPGTMELMPTYESFATSMGSNFTAIDYNEAVFRRGRRFMSANNGHDTYCCVAIFHASLSPGDGESHDQAPDIIPYIKDNMHALIENEVPPYSLIEQPSYRWVDIAGTKAIEASYSRTGDDGPTTCRLYLLQNYDEIAKVVVAYREKDAHLWKTDLEKVISTFEWNNPK